MSTEEPTSEPVSEIKVVKFTSGEEIIARIYYDEDGDIHLHHILKLVLIPDQGLTFMPYSFSVFQETNLVIHPKNILWIAEPRPEIKPAYQKEWGEVAAVENRLVLPT